MRYLKVGLLLGQENAFQVVGIVVLEIDDRAARLLETTLNGKVDVFVASME